MSIDHRTMWTCNRCKKVANQPYSQQPGGWQRIGLSNVGAPDGSLAPWGHLCNDCRTGLQSWLCSPPHVDEESQR